MMQPPATSPPRAQGPAHGRPDSWSLAKDAWGRGWRLHEYRCPGCGYDLEGSPAPDDVFRCPECGQETQRYEAIIPPKERTSWWARLRLPMLVCLGICLLWLVTGVATIFIVPVALFVAFVLHSILGPLVR